jgi:glycopeptide antibiotics resistance protein
MTMQRSADRQAAGISSGYRNRHTPLQHHLLLADAMTTATAKRSSTTVATIVLFVVYLALLTWIILWRLELPYAGATARVVKLVPFVAAPGFGASAPSEVLANILLFVPFGLYLGVLAPSWSWWRAGAVMAGTSILYEIVQFLLAVGSSDITDVITNTAGGLAGFALLVLLRRRAGDRADTRAAQALGILTVLAVIACGLFFVSPLHYGPPDHGRLHRSLVHSAG